MQPPFLVRGTLRIEYDVVAFFYPINVIEQSLKQTIDPIRCRSCGYKKNPCYLTGRNAGRA